MNKWVVQVQIAAGRSKSGQLSGVRQPPPPPPAERKAVAVGTKPKEAGSTGARQPPRGQATQPGK